MSLGMAEWLCLGGVALFFIGTTALVFVNPSDEWWYRVGDWAVKASIAAAVGAVIAALAYP